LGEKKLDIISTACEIIKDIMKLDENEPNYSNPKMFLTLPFLYPGKKKPVDRFTIYNDHFFTFMGRKEFRNTLETIYKLRSGSGYMKLFINGNVG
jgi:hypothetical protein